MKYGVIFFLTIFLFVSCATSRYSAAEIERFKKIENPLERWKAHNIHNYNFQIRINCFCTFGGEYRVSVRNDKVEEILQTHNSDRSLRKEPKKITTETLHYFQTFDGYYKWFESLNEDNEVRAEFQPDSIYGYPKTFGIESVESETFKITNVEFLD